MGVIPLANLGQDGREKDAGSRRVCLVVGAGDVELSLWAGQCSLLTSLVQVVQTRRVHGPHRRELQKDIPSAQSHRVSEIRILHQSRQRRV